MLSKEALQAAERTAPPKHGLAKILGKPGESYGVRADSECK